MTSSLRYLDVLVELEGLDVGQVVGVPLEVETGQKLLNVVVEVLSIIVLALLVVLLAVEPVGVVDLLVSKLLVQSDILTEVGDTTFEVVLPLVLVLVSLVLVVVVLVLVVVVRELVLVLLLLLLLLLPLLLLLVVDIVVGVV